MRVRGFQYMVISFKGSVTKRDNSASSEEILFVLRCWKSRCGGNDLCIPKDAGPAGLTSEDARQPGQQQQHFFEASVPSSEAHLAPLLGGWGLCASPQEWLIPPVLDLWFLSLGEQITRRGGVLKIQCPGCLPRAPKSESPGGAWAAVFITISQLILVQSRTGTH